MKILSINVGRPRDVQQGDRTVTTSIFKAPVSGPVVVNRLNLAGDQQSDLTVHGGRDKAVYVYPSEHYEFWRQELPDTAFLRDAPPWGAFGENFTTEGLLEDAIHVGDRLQIGSAEFSVTQPRQPCFKLALRFGRPDMVKRFLLSGRTGFYLRVIREGTVVAGDRIDVTPSEGNSMTVANIFKLYMDEGADRSLLRRASDLPGLSDGWRDDFRERAGNTD